MNNQSNRGRLAVSLSEANLRITEQINRGRSLIAPDYQSVQTLTREEPKWVAFVHDMLKYISNNNVFADEFLRCTNFMIAINPSDKVAVARARILKRIDALESIQERLILAAEASEGNAERDSGEFFWELCIHPKVRERCLSLYKSSHFADAVEKSLKVVKDRLRELTGFEKGSEAFGKGKLHIKGAVAKHVDDDFNEGVQFLMMAIDRFRNEKSHTSEANITEPGKAFQYLALSSLAMRFLDDAEIRHSP